MTTLKESTEDASGLYARIQKTPQYNSPFRLEDFNALINSMSAQYKTTKSNHYDRPKRIHRTSL